MKQLIFSLLLATCFLLAASSASLINLKSQTSAENQNPINSQKPLSQTSQVSISSLFFNFTTGLQVPASGIQDINLFLGNVTSSSLSYLESWDYFTDISDPFKSNHNAALNFTYGLQLSGHVITHFLNAYLSGYNSVKTFRDRFTNYEHMILSLNSTFYTYLLEVTAAQMSIIVNAQNSLWNIVTKEIGRLFKYTFLTQAVAYTAPAALQKEQQKEELKSNQLFYTDPLELKIKHEAEALKRRENYEQLKALSLEGFTTDYYYYPVERSTFTDTDRLNLYKHFLFYANLLQESAELVSCPVAYVAFTTPFFTSMTHFSTVGTSTDSLVNGLYTLAQSFAYIYEAYSTCWILGNLQYVSLGAIYTNIGGNWLYWVTNLQNRRVEIANLSTAYYPCLRMGDWECVARVSGQLVSLIFTTVSA